MHRTYLTKYRDKNGEEMTSISNDGRTLSMVVRGVEFRGSDFDSLKLAGTLCMAHTHTIRRCHEELRITFDPLGRELHFEYWSHLLSSLDRGRDLAASRRASQHLNGFCEARSLVQNNPWGSVRSNRRLQIVQPQIRPRDENDP